MRADALHDHGSPDRFPFKVANCDLKHTADRAFTVPACFVRAELPFPFDALRFKSNDAVHEASINVPDFPSADDWGLKLTLSK